MTTLKKPELGGYPSAFYAANFKGVLLGGKFFVGSGSGSIDTAKTCQKDT
jgi:hypothetical protein